MGEPGHFRLRPFEAGVGPHERAGTGTDDGMVQSVLNGGFPVVEACGDRGGTLSEVTGVADEKEGKTEEDDPGECGEADALETGVDAHEQGKGGDGDQPAGAGPGPPEAGGGEQDKEGRGEEEQGGSKAGPRLGEDSNQHGGGEQDQSCEGVGVDEGTMDAAAGQFVEDDGMGDIRAVGADDETIGAEAVEFGRGEVGPAGLLSGEEDIPITWKLDEVLVDGLKPAKGGGGPDAEEQGERAEASANDSEEEEGDEGSQVGEGGGGEVGIRGGGGADALPGKPKHGRPPDPAGDAAGEQGSEGVGNEQPRGTDQGEEQAPDPRGPRLGEPIGEGFGRTDLLLEDDGIPEFEDGEAE